jgi:DNA polymerase-3 subunit beta
MLEKLHRFIEMARSIVPVKSTLPILECVCVNGGKISVSDLQHSVEMDLDDNRSYLIPFKVLSKVIKTKPGNLSVEVGSYKHTILYDGKSISCPAINIEEYPALPEGDFRSLGSIDMALLKMLRSQCDFVSKDDLKPALNNVHLVKNGSGSMVATDGHLLKVLSDIKLDGQKGYTADLSPKLIGLLLKQKRSAMLSMSSKHIRFDCGSVSIYQNRSSEKYPDTDSVIPKDSSGSSIVSRDELKKLVRDATPFSHPETKLGKVEIGGDSLSIMTNNPEDGTTWNGSCDLKRNDGDSIVIGFNLQYLDKLVRGIDGDDIMLKYNTPLTAMLLSPLEKNGYGELGLIMPIRLEGGDNE